MKNLLTLLVVLTLAGSALAGPDCRISETDYNFGKTVQKSTLTHDFWIYSTGDAPLEILEVVPGCGCTKSWLSDSLIAPGDSARLHIIFATGRYRGNVSKRPYIITNMSEDKVFMKINANLQVKPEEGYPIAVNPGVVDVSQFDERPRTKAGFMIENRTEGVLTLKLTDVASKSFTVKLPETVNPGESVQGVIFVNESALGSGFEESFTFEVTGTEREYYSIPVRRMLKGKITNETGGK